MLVMGKCKSCDTDGWIGYETDLCQTCEIETGERWGHHGAKAETPGTIARKKAKAKKDVPPAKA